MKQKLVAGIDIGGTNTTFGLVNSAGKILYKETISTTHFPKPEQLVDAVCNQIICALAKFTSKYRLIGAGVGAPNGNFFNGTIEFAPNLKWKGIIPLAKLIEKRLKIETLLTNDANAATLGEMLFGGAKGMNDFIFITLGTGLGSGIVANGQLIYGHDSFAGELGHIIVEPNGRHCGCGRQGCLETYCSATGIVKTFKEFSKNKYLPSKINSKFVYEKAMDGDKNAMKAFEFTGEILGLALANSVAFTSPKAIFLFGGLANAGDLIFKPTKKSFEKNLLNIYKNKIKILPSKLKENDAAILGAASLIWKHSKLI